MLARVAGTLSEKMYGFFMFNRAEFLNRYHQRSNAETTFSIFKAKFRASARSKKDTAMKNEVLCKFLCHNIVVVHAPIKALGIAANFWEMPSIPMNKVVYWWLAWGSK